jgi:hypothetical protein
MAWFFFRRDTSDHARGERAAAMERRLADNLRTLSLLFQRAADRIEARRLERQGIQQPARFLERSDKPPPP